MSEVTWKWVCGAVKQCLSAALLPTLLSVFLFTPVYAVAAENSKVGWIGLPREPIHINVWPEDAKVAVCFLLNVEEWGFGQGPPLIPDMAMRNPDMVGEGFRQYGIHEGISRVGRLFKEHNAPLSIALNALFLKSYPDVWKELRSLAPDAPIVGHGMNNSDQLLPLGRGLAAQREYIRNALDIIESGTGVRPAGWTSPRVYPNLDTFVATAAEKMTFSLDAMDSDTLSRVQTPNGSLLLIPYPTVTVDMTQSLVRHAQAQDIAQLWIDYVDELVRESVASPTRSATVVVVGIHPFISGTPDGAAGLRRVLTHILKDNRIWLTDVHQVMDWQAKHAQEGK